MEKIDYFENILKEDRLLTRIHVKARKKGLDRISEEEIESEIKAARKAQAEKAKGKRR